jgi:serine/threonine-protein kinase RsbW
MAEQLALEFQSTFASISSATTAVSGWLADRGASEFVQSFASLAVEELATNCVKYGYDDPNEHTLEVYLSISESDLVLTFTDDARPFNPLLVPVPDINLAVEERPVGRLGIHLLRQLADRMEYSREADKNRVTLHKTLIAR